MNDIYSLHTFLFPFAWEDDGIDMAGLFSSDGTDNIWVTADTSVQACNFSRAVLLEDMKPGEYNAFHYFNEAARDLVFSDRESGLVHNFKVKDSILSGTEYIISKGENTYSLDIDEILLHIFSTDIAILELKCRNTNHRSLEAVKAINEYGRRITMPFWPENGFTKCADCLELKGPHINERDDFRSYKHDKVSFCYVTKILRYLLNKNGMGRIFRARRAENENEIRISTAVDEKMFVCCLINDSSFSGSLYEAYDNNGGSFGADGEACLAELLYVEPEGSCGRKNIAAVRDRLYGCIFFDELAGECPKLTAVTDQAYIKLMGCLDHDAEYFENIYTKIILLGLAQRMSVAKFSAKIKRWTKDIGSSGEKITMRKVNGVMSLQKQFVIFQNQYVLREITVKNEGRFLYDHIREMLNIGAEYSDISAQISSLYELVSTVQGSTFNKWGLALSLIAMELSVIGHIGNVDSFLQIDMTNFNGTFVILTEIVIAAIIIWLVTGVIFNKRGK